MTRLGSTLQSRNSQYPYGVSWNESSNTYTNINSVNSYLNLLRPCLVTPGSEGSGDIILNPLDYTQKLSDGSTVLLDGSQGQVMMRFPLFYYKYSYSGTTHSYQVSISPFTGASVHPWFNKSGDGTTFVPYRYIGVYPAVGWTTTYQNGDGVNAWFNTSTGKLGSIGGKKCLTNINRTNFRSAATRIGSGWQLFDFWGYSALKLLYITRYRNLNSQSVLGSGNSQFSSWVFNSCISATGKVKSINATGKTTVGGNIGDYSNLFGLEDIYGGVWQWLDGWNINSGVNYVCSNPALFADGTTTNYTNYGITNPLSNNWQQTFQQNVAMLPATGSASASYITDYYYYSSGWMAPVFGGSANYGSPGGVFCLAANDGASYVYSYLGGRVCF